MISLGISVLPRHWNDKTSSVKTGHPNSGRLNSFILHKLSETRDLILESETKNKYVSSTKLKQLVLGGGSVDFVEYYEREVKNLQQIGKVASYRKYKSMLGKVMEYQKGRKLFFEDIDVTWLKNYEIYLKTHYSNSQNTVHSNLKVIRKLFNDAIREDLVSKDLYPFDRFKLVWEKKKSNEHLEEQEVKKLIELDIERGSSLDLVRNMFVFSCYAGGLRVSDLLLLKWSNYDGSNINFTCRKTGENQSIKLPKLCQDILMRYGQSTACESDQRIFPWFVGGEDVDSSTFYNQLSSATARYNAQLKKLANKARLKDRPISSHWARRTFTCMALAKGLNLDIVSKILGHDGQTVTLESYARYSQSNLHKAMDIFDS